MDWPAIEPGLRGERPATKRLTHGTARNYVMHTIFITAVEVDCATWYRVTVSIGKQTYTQVINRGRAVFVAFVITHSQGYRWGMTLWTYNEYGCLMRTRNNSSVQVAGCNLRENKYFQRGYTTPYCTLTRKNFLKPSPWSSRVPLRTVHEYCCVRLRYNWSTLNVMP